MDAKLHFFLESTKKKFTFLSNCQLYFRLEVLWLNFNDVFYGEEAEMVEEMTKSPGEGDVMLVP